MYKVVQMSLGYCDHIQILMDGPLIVGWNLLTSDGVHLQGDEVFVFLHLHVKDSVKTGFDGQNKRNICVKRTTYY